MQAAAIALPLIGGFMAAAGTEQSGRLAQQAAEMDAKALELERQAGKTQAAIEEENRQQQLGRVLAAQRAAFGASGFAGESGSFGAIQTADISEAFGQRRQAKLFADIEATQKTQAAAQARFGGFAARQQAKTQARAQMLGGISGAVTRVADLRLRGGSLLGGKGGGKK